jgi:hypothetical protein
MFSRLRGAVTRHASLRRRRARRPERRERRTRCGLQLVEARRGLRAVPLSADAERRFGLVGALCAGAHRSRAGRGVGELQLERGSLRARRAGEEALARRVEHRLAIAARRVAGRRRDEAQKGKSTHVFEPFAHWFVTHLGFFRPRLVQSASSAHTFWQSQLRVTPGPASPSSQLFAHVCPPTVHCALVMHDSRPYIGEQASERQQRMPRRRTLIPAKVLAPRPTTT